jgi:hypothetical protein
MHVSAIGIWWGTAVTLLLLIVPTLTALVLDRRSLDGDRVWAKPLKFEFSLAIHFATLAWLAANLPPAIVNDWPFYDAVLISVAATAFEIVYICIQAARQQRSHFNIGTPLLKLLYGLMAIGAMIITAAAGLVGVLLLLCETPSVGSGIKMGGGVGLMAGAFLTFITAFRMGGAMTATTAASKTAPQGCL